MTLNCTNSGWNNDSNPQEQSPTNNQQIPLSSGPPPGRGNFQGGFGGRGNASNNNWNPPVQGQQLQQAPPATLMTNPPPNMNQPPPKMVRSVCFRRRLESDGETCFRNCGWKPRRLTRSRITITQLLAKRLGSSPRGSTSKSWRRQSLKPITSSKWSRLSKNQTWWIRRRWGELWGFKVDARN